jgi:hypothetical protein
VDEVELLLVDDVELVDVLVDDVEVLLVDEVELVLVVVVELVEVVVVNVVLVLLVVEELVEVLVVVGKPVCNPAAKMLRATKRPKARTPRPIFKVECGAQMRNVA